MSGAQVKHHRTQRRSNAVVIAVVSLTIIVGFTWLAILGVLRAARAEIQRTAIAAETTGKSCRYGNARLAVGVGGLIYVIDECAGDFSPPNEMQFEGTILDDVDIMTETHDYEHVWPSRSASGATPPDAVDVTTRRT
jgi:hypothetical protein